MKSLYNIIKFILTHPLASKNKVEALKRFCFYQINKLFNTYPIIYSFTEKTKLIVERGMTGATGNIYCGLHEFEDMGFLLHFLRPEDLFVDVGANVGSYTVLASGHVECKTIAFEPIPTTFQRLQNNIIINHMNSLVICYNMGLAAKKDIIYFTSNLDTINHVVENDKSKNVVSMSVDSLDSILKNECPLLLKIDVEGYETEVISGSNNILKNPKLKAIIIELNGSGVKYGFNDESIHITLLNHNFVPYRYDPFRKNLIKLDSFGTHNTLYLRDLDFIYSRLSSASTFKVLNTEI